MFFLAGVCQVLDVGVQRIVSTEVSLYAEWFGGAHPPLVHGGAVPTMRSANNRFSYACRVCRVPHVIPGYDQSESHSDPFFAHYLARASFRS